MIYLHFLMLLLILPASPTYGDPVDNVHIALYSNKGIILNCKITVVNMINEKPVILSEGRANGSEICVMKFYIPNPKVVQLDLNGELYLLYLCPKYNLNIYVDSEGGRQAVHFKGKGSDAANYLLGGSLLKSKYLTYRERPIFELEPTQIVERFDSLDAANSAFDKYQASSTKLPHRLRKILYDVVRIEALTFKLNYLLAKYSGDTVYNRRVSLLIQSAISQVPFDSTFLSIELPSYPMLMSMYLEENIYTPLLSNKTKQKEGITDTLYPLLSDERIRNGDYSSILIKSYLVAKNINYWMNRLGIIRSVDSILHHYGRDWKGSRYTSILQKRHDEWLIISAGKTAPQIAGTTPDGKFLSTKDLNDKIIYVDIWATWCTPCRAEMPFSIQLQKEFRDRKDVVFLYVSTDRNQNSWRKVLTENPEFGGIHINQSDSKRFDSVYRTYLISGIPRYLIIDRNGKIVDSNAPRPSSGKVKALIQGLLP